MASFQDADAIPSVAVAAGTLVALGTGETGTPAAVAVVALNEGAVL